MRTIAHTPLLALGLLLLPLGWVSGCNQTATIVEEVADAETSTDTGTSIQQDEGLDRADTVRASEDTSAALPDDTSNDVESPQDAADTALADSGNQPDDVG
ncbi:MAG: hypothetical protein AAFS10_17035, partial [Myxococcota bacterium]